MSESDRELTLRLAREAAKLVDDAGGDNCEYHKQAILARAEELEKS